MLHTCADALKKILHADAFKKKGHYQSKSAHFCRCFKKELLLIHPIFSKWVLGTMPPCFVTGFELGGRPQISLVYWAVWLWVWLKRWLVNSLFWVSLLVRLLWSHCQLGWGVSPLWPIHLCPVSRVPFGWPSYKAVSGLRPYKALLLVVMYFLVELWQSICSGGGLVRFLNSLRYPSSLWLIFRLLWSIVWIPGGDPTPFHAHDGWSSQIIHDHCWLRFWCTC